ncbi:MAG: hypothetical protein WBB28_20820 [Crinalium sp.]
MKEQNNWFNVAKRFRHTLDGQIIITNGDQSLDIALKEFLVLEPSYAVFSADGMIQNVLEFDYIPEKTLTCLSTSSGTVSVPPFWEKGDYYINGVSSYVKGERPIPTAGVSLGQSLQEIKQRLIVAIDVEAEERNKAIVAGRQTEASYSWPIKIQVAQNIIKLHDEGKEFQVPAWFKQEIVSSRRSITELELAQTILKKDAEFRMATGIISGARTRKRDEVMALDSIGLALNYSVTSDWEA